MIKRLISRVDETTVAWFDGIAQWMREYACDHEGKVIGRMEWTEEHAYAYDQCVGCGKEWWPDD